MQNNAAQMYTPELGHSDRARFIQGLRDVAGYTPLNDNDENDEGANYALFFSSQYSLEMGYNQGDIKPADYCKIGSAA